MQGVAAKFTAPCTSAKKEPIVRKRDKYKPAVSKSVLIFLAGFVWVCVGTMLLLRAVLWISATADVNRYIFIGAGVAMALCVHHFGFSKIADRNVARLLPVDGKKCLFSFMPWKSYLIVLVMIAMGVGLRHSAIPRQYLGIVYTCIGLALLLSSGRYFRAFFREIRH